MATEQSRQDHADLLDSVLAQARGRLRARPLSAVTLVVDLLAGDVLPWLAAREGGRTSSVYLDLSQSAEALTIIALRPSLRRAAAPDLRMVGAQLDKLRILASSLREIEARSGPETVALAETEAARQRLYFVSPPTRPATEAHVLRHRPRPVETWSPEPTGQLRAADRRLRL